MFQTHSVDLVITDILMPDKDGLAVIRELRGINPQVKIIGLSGGGMILSAQTSLNVARKLGVVRTMSKPFAVDRLLAMVTEVIAVSEK
ncbi:MAG: response regulator [Magnetococcus sp. DMHC-6]